MMTFQTMDPSMRMSAPGGMTMPGGRMPGAMGM